jgi:hypothetical protein
VGVNIFIQTVEVRIVFIQHGLDSLLGGGDVERFRG